MRSVLVRSGATVAAGAAALMTLLAASPVTTRLDGYQITMKMTVEMPATEMPVGMPPGPMNMDMVIKTADGRLRMEIDFAKFMGTNAGYMAAAGAMLNGTYILLQPDGKMLTVMPSMRVAMSADAGSLLSGGMGAGDVSEKVDTAPGWLKVTDLGAGERVAGYATRRFRADMKFKTTVDENGLKTTETNDSSYEFWITTDRGDVMAALRAFDKATGNSVVGGQKEISDALMSKLPPNSSVLRAVGHNLTNEGKTSMKMEVTEIKKATFEPAEFEVPPGVQVMDMNAMTGGRGRN